MENYYSVYVVCPEPNKELLMATLDLLNYESFLETEDGFEAFISEPAFDEAALTELLKDFENAAIQNIKLIPPQNWNETWESSFEPVVINQNIRIRAPFHEADNRYKYEIIIMPKTSFGTGHHETTATILTLMEPLPFKDKKVLDFGSGTGILAIFASMLGASEIIANDIDKWAADNIEENKSLNQLHNINFTEGGLEETPGENFDFVLANINRNILAQYMQQLAQRLNVGGTLLISGFYENDLPYLIQYIEAAGLKVTGKEIKNNWCAACLMHQ